MSKKGYWIIILSIVLTGLFTYFEASKYYSNKFLLASLVSSSIAFSLFFWIFSISSKLGYMEKYFSSLDKLYFHHKVLSVLAIVLLMVHGNMMERYKGEGTSLAAQGGRVSIMMFMGFTVLSLIGLTMVRRKKLIGYELWKNSHRIMLLPFLIGSYHSFNNGYLRILNGSIYGVWMSMLIFSGLILAIYSSIVYEFLAFRKRLKIIDINKLNSKVVEITIEKPIRNIKIGQFGFFKFYGKGLKKESHPFTFSEVGDDFIKLTTKVSGDFTKSLYDSITLNHTVAIDGPYGKFDYSIGGEKQLWIAGGIGITPFNSFISTNIPEKYNIKLYYVYKNNDDSVYKNDIMDKISSNIEYHPVSTSEDGRPNFAEIISEYDPSDIFICGPVKMKKSIINKASELGLSKESIHYEKFYF